MTTQSKNLTDLIVDQINEMSEQELISLNNAYCGSIGSESRVYDNDEDFLNENFSSASDAVRACYFGDYRFSDNYVQFNGYGNLESTNYFEVPDLEDYPYNIAKYAVDNQSEFDMFDFDELESQLEDDQNED